MTGILLSHEISPVAWHCLSDEHFTTEHQRIREQMRKGVMQYNPDMNQKTGWSKSSHGVGSNLQGVLAEI